LFIVLSVSAVKDAFEDWRRHRADHVVNASVTNVVREGNVVATRWDQVHVGDVVKLQAKDQIPADMLILATSGKDNECFVETKNLDGETNLKMKYGLHQTQAIRNEADLNRFYLRFILLIFFL